jgi:AcrR family transcriptional regulator
MDLSSAEVPAPPWAPRPRGSRVGRDKPQLSRDAIVEAAVRVIDAEGIDALSMRRVAQEFGTGAASLYAYVANKDELMELLVDWVMREVVNRWRGPEPTAENWRELAKDSVRLSRDVLVEHRDLAKAFIGRIPFGPYGLQAVELQLSILRAGGLPDQIAAYAGDLLGTYLVSEAIEEQIWRTRFPDADSAQLREKMGEISDYLSALPIDRFPNLVALAGPMMSQGDRFELGLEVIMRGLASFVEGND